MPLAHSFSRKALIKITRLVKLSQALNNYRKRGVVGKMRGYKRTCTCTCSQEQNNYVTDECTMLVAAGIMDSFLINFKRCYY